MVDQIKVGDIFISEINESYYHKLTIFQKVDKETYIIYFNERDKFESNVKGIINELNRGQYKKQNAQIIKEKLGIY